MKHIILINFLSITLILVACHGEKATVVSQNKIETADENPKENDVMKKVIIDAIRAVPDPAGKTYRIKSFSLNENILSIEVTYRGGCGKHNFELLSNGLLKKSLPPQYDVYLEHLKENETCNEEQMQTLRFDISPLNRMGNPKIIVNINSNENKVEWLTQ